MKIGLISDTHGNIEYVEETANKMIKDYQVDTLIFLGDECEDIELVKEMFKSYILVPGVFCEHYKNKSMPHRMIKEFQGFKVLITHTTSSHENDFDEDIKPEEITKQEKIDIVFYGHTHIPSIERKDGVIWINPGHLKKEDKRGYPASFGIVDFDKKEAMIIELLSNKEIYKINF